MKIIRIYADTSVFGGIVDSEFQKASKSFFAQIKDGQFTLVTSAINVTDEALALRKIYLKQRLATVAHCAIIVSWNFKHIVHFDKIALYNAVNVSIGYNQIAIFSPMEVMNYE